ncbi:hydroxyisourate hydrolase [Cellulosimicrobium terreum]|nr:hydroxyisourate hydrolase [Cellulosimicrobium terreum]
MTTHASHITTHVLDAARGRPAEGIAVRLEAAPAIAEGTTGQGWTLVASSRTNDDGRVPELGPASLVPGTYRLVFDTADYFDRLNTVSFYPEVVIVFRVASAEQHYHVPVLLSPFAYSTYRGS